MIKMENITGAKNGCPKKLRDDLLLFGVWTACNKKNMKKAQCNPTVLKGFGNFGDQMFNAAEKMAGNGWSHINRMSLMNSDSTDSHKVFFVGMFF